MKFTVLPYGMTFALRILYDVIITKNSAITWRAFDELPYCSFQCYHRNDWRTRFAATLDCTNNSNVALGLFCFSHKRLFLQTKNTADLFTSLPFVVLLYKINGLHNRVDETAFFDDVLNELGERLSLICFACCFVGDDACVKVYGNCVALFDILCRLVTFKNRKTDVD